MKSILKLLKKRNSGGFTLVEVIVSTALIAILLAGIMLFISPIIQTFNDTSKSFTAENTATCVDEYITKNIRNASQIAIFANTNETDLQSTYGSQIATMNSYCSKINGSASAENKTYLLKCLSLKFDSTDNRYYLYEEEVDMNAGGALKSGKSTEIYSKALYNGLYLTMDFSIPDDQTKDESGAVSGAKRKDALQTVIRAYDDETYSDLVFQGTGITELRQIKVMLANGGTEANYYIKLFPDTIKSFGDTDAGSRDIYIYYVVRQLSAVTTP